MDQISILGALSRSTILFIVLLVFARILGKKQMSHMTFFNYITGITIGSLAANIVLLSDEPFFYKLISLTWWCILTGLTGLINLKFGNLRHLIDDQPSIVIKKGKLMKKELTANRLNMDDLSMMLREQGIFSIMEVDYAILEPDGKISVLKKPQETPVTKKNMNIPSPAISYIPTELIVDGKIIKKNLTEFQLDETWLMTQLKQQNFEEVEEVFYAELQSDGSLFIEKK